MAPVLSGLRDDYGQISHLMTEWIWRRDLEFLRKPKMTARADFRKEVVGFSHHFRWKKLPFLALVAWLTTLFAFAWGFLAGFFFIPRWIGRRRTGGI
jgi:hypothetical protein